MDKNIEVGETHFDDSEYDSSLEDYLMSFNEGIHIF